MKIYKSKGGQKKQWLVKNVVIYIEDFIMDK